MNAFMTQRVKRTCHGLNSVTYLAPRIREQVPEAIRLL